jgi:hypothetical protein
MLWACVLFNGSSVGIGVLSQDPCWQKIIKSLKLTNFKDGICAMCAQIDLEVM